MDAVHESHLGRRVGSCRHVDDASQLMRMMEIAPGIDSYRSQLLVLEEAIRKPAGSCPYVVDDQVTRRMSLGLGTDSNPTDKSRPLVPSQRQRERQWYPSPPLSSSARNSTSPSIDAVPSPGWQSETVSQAHVRPAHASRSLATHTILETQTNQFLFTPSNPQPSRSSSTPSPPPTRSSSRSPTISPVAYRDSNPIDVSRSR